MRITSKLFAGFLMGAVIGAPAALATEIKLPHPAPVSGGQFGNAVAAEGDVIVVAQQLAFTGFPGRVHVYRDTGSGFALEQTIADFEVDAAFGSGVDIEGDTLIVGANLADDVASNSGAAHVYRFDGTAWVEEQTLAPPGLDVSDVMGSYLALDGDVALISSQGDDDVASGAGAAYVYRFDGSTWIEEQKLVASDGAAFDAFSSGGVDLDGDWAVVGAPAADPSASASGAAYVYRHDGSSWIEHQKLVQAGGVDFDNFGASVAIDGDTLAIGQQKSAAGTDPGRVHVYRYDGSFWVLEQTVMSGLVEGDGFGSRLDLAGDLLVVGAYRADGAAVDSGMAFAFTRSGTTWTHAASYQASDGATSDAFGRVAIAGDTLVVGAPLNDEPTSNEGSAYLYELTAPSAWNDEGCALAGASGEPLLVGSGDLGDGSSNALDLSNAAPSATAGLFLAIGPVTPAGFKGGTLKPVPLLMPPLILVTGGAGGLSLPFVMPSGVPAGTELHVQIAIQDAGAPKGVALSNAVRGTTP